ncbi:TetR/AcrR family transcriptional regulator [Nonomuraea sp. M3C6]|uniref:TetR/AcrR family transcriptional regulator n=1 Tax=Nonomuraea marmarensis TaxID=3351344 RepID=A0ABW7A6Q9_9ACTN
MSDVKRPNKKAQKSAETRRRIRSAAGELFMEQGYGATTLQQVADRAEVAVQTIYFVFGNKRALLKEFVDVAIAGDDQPIATMERAWFKEALATGTAERHLRSHVAGTRAVLERVAAITRLLEVAVASDPDLAELWPQQEDPRYVVHDTAARSLMSKPGARLDVSPERAADLLYAVLSPELYLLFVRDRGWRPEEFERWASGTLRTQLCADRR